MGWSPGGGSGPEPKGPTLNPWLAKPPLPSEGCRSGGVLLPLRGGLPLPAAA
jgi:hypothetical protein